MPLLGYLARFGTIALALVLSLALATTAFAAGRPLYADLGPASTDPAVSDQDGAGKVRLTLNQGRGRICYAITVQNIEPVTLAHIHDVATGDVVVPLIDDPEDELTGCVTGLDKWLVKAIRQNASDYYVNVHNAMFPDGAIQGQLSKKRS